MIDEKANLCCGCKLCCNLCPTQAIDIRNYKVLNYRPHVDYDKCIKCGKCINNCPFISFSSKTNNLSIAYAAQSKKIDDFAGSSSGGIASSLMLYALKNNYLVYSTFFHNGQFCVRHIDDLKCLRMASGSKYVYSNPTLVYKEIADKLPSNRVLFIGTPCQVYALKSFIPLKHQNMLTTVDLVCHGTPTQEFLNSYLTSKKIFIEEVKNISFRKGSLFEIEVFREKENSLFKESARFNPYYTLFLSGSSFQDGCYSCPFASSKRYSDLTLGDYWGAPETIKTKFRYKNRVSLVLVSTENGKLFLSGVESELTLIETNYDYAISCNPQLQYPSELTSDRVSIENSYNKYKNENFDFLTKKTSIPKLIRKRKIKSFIKRLFRRENREV